MQAASAALYVDGQPVHVEAFESLSCARGMPVMVWEDDAEWLYADDTRDGVYVDDLAVWSHALTFERVAQFHRQSVGTAGLVPDIWQHVVWSLSGSQQTWFVNGEIRRQCYGTPVHGAGDLLVGKHAGGVGFYGQMKDLQIRSDSEEIVGPLHLHVKAVKTKPAYTTRLAAESRLVRRGTPPPLTNERAGEDITVTWPAEPSFVHDHSYAHVSECTGCSADCDNACHTSHYTFDVVAGVSVADVSGNARHVLLESLDFDSNGVHGTGCVKVCVLPSFIRKYNAVVAVYIV